MDCSGLNPKRSTVDGLPEDSLVEILARVPVRSICRSKCVAKGWRDLIEDPLHGKKIPQTLQGFFSIHGKIHGRGRRGSGAAKIGFTSLRASSAPLGIDSRLSFLTKLPGTKILTLADSCNGLLLFEHGPKSGPYDSDRLGYIVCNPATKHWVSVPRSPYPRGETSYTYLVFDQVVSSHFHIVQFWFEFKEVVSFEEVQEDDYTDDLWELRHRQRYTDVNLFEKYIHRHRCEQCGGIHDQYDDSHDHNDDDDDEEEEEEELQYREVTEEAYRISVHIYSSETGTWSHVQSDWEEELGQLEGWRHEGFIPRKGWGCAVLNGVLHFIISDQEERQDQIVAVDVHGETQRAIPLPAMVVRWPGYVAQSQGRLHYINQASGPQLSIWVLEDYDTQKWVLKHRVSFVELFGKRWRPGYENEHRVVAMHPDGNMVFIVQNRKLISYDMDHKLVNVIGTSENNVSAEHIVPYVPCFLESPALTNKH